MISIYMKDVWIKFSVGYPPTSQISANQIDIRSPVRYPPDFVYIDNSFVRHRFLWTNARSRHQGAHRARQHCSQVSGEIRRHNIFELTSSLTSKASSYVTMCDHALPCCRYGTCSMVTHFHLCMSSLMACRGF